MAKRRRRRRTGSMRTMGRLSMSGEVFRSRRRLHCRPRRGPPRANSRRVARQSPSSCARLRQSWAPISTSDAPLLSTMCLHPKGVGSTGRCAARSGSSISLMREVACRRWKAELPDDLAWHSCMRQPICISAHIHGIGRCVHDRGWRRGVRGDRLTRSTRAVCAVCSKRRHAASAGVSQGGQFARQSLREHSRPQQLRHADQTSPFIRRSIRQQDDGLYAVWRTYLRRTSNSGSVVSTAAYQQCHMLAPPTSAERVWKDSADQGAHRSQGSRSGARRRERRRLDARRWAATWRSRETADQFLEHADEAALRHVLCDPALRRRVPGRVRRASSGPRARYRRR